MPRALRVTVQDDAALRAESTAGPALREPGLSAPEKVSIIGIDDHQMGWFRGLRPKAWTLKSLPAGHLLDTTVIEQHTTRRKR